MSHSEKNSFKLQWPGKSKRSSQGVLRSCELVLTIVGEANEVLPLINGQKLTVLLDTGSIISTMAESLCKRLGLIIEPLNRLLSIEGVGGHAVPYLGYVEVQLHSMEIQRQEFPPIMPVVPDTAYHQWVPVMLGTNVGRSDCKSGFYLEERVQAVVNNPDSLGEVRTTQSLDIPASAQMIIYGRTRLRPVS